jgi:capsular exopolysaccharide synthesis family protein
LAEERPLSTQEPNDRELASAESEFDLRAYVDVLRAHKWLIAGCTLVVGLVAMLVTSRQPRIYQATCVIEYDPSPMRPLGHEVEDVADPVGNYWRSQEFFQTQNQILQSRALAERVVHRLGLHHDAGFLGRKARHGGGDEGVSAEVAARRLQGRVTVEPVASTRLVRVSVTDGDPERAQLIANTLVDVYTEKTVEDRLGSTVTALEWLGTQLDGLREELNSAELALHDFKEEHNVLSVSLEDQRNLVAQEILHFSEALTEIRMRRIALQARMDVLDGAERDDPMQVHAPIANEDAALVALRTRILEAEQERNTLAVRYGENHPDIQRADAQLETLRRQFREELDRVVDAAAAELAEVRKNEAGLRAALDEAHTAGLDLNLREIEYSRLQRERENKAQVYQLVLQRATEADLTRMLQTTYVRVVDRALRPSYPIRPSIKNNTMAGVGVGLALGVALAILLSRLDRRIKTIQQAEGFGFPVLGILPRMPSDPERARRPSRRRKHTPEPVMHSPAQDLLVHTHPTSEAAECCRSIRTNLTFMSVDEPFRSLVVTSGHPEEGKTTVIISLAISLAQSGKKVLLVDTDLRRPQIHRAFDVDPSSGITSVLAGEMKLRAAAVDTEVPGLSILPVGPIPPNPAELLHSRPFAALIEEVHERWDIALFDSPPANVVTDAAIIAPQVDAAIIVVKSGRTTRDSLRRTLRQLGDVAANVVGLVFNDVNLSERGQYAAGYYRYRYGAYYGRDAEAHPNAAE